MENIYKAYSREVNGKTFFFVKKYNVFPEFKDYPKILDSMGMHTDFYRAYHLAKINDEAILNQLVSELNILPEPTKSTQMHGVRAVTHTLIKNTHQALLKLRLAGIN